MNNEREMLELAAKAAGIEIETGIYFYDAGFKVTGTATYWNPILSDADALRLAVKLHINIEHLRPLTTMEFNEVVASPYGRGDCVSIELTKGDPYAATRRAITRAAAEIGRAMPATPIHDHQT